MKRILATVGAAAMVVASATPALGFWYQPRSNDTLENKAKVSNEVLVISNSGLNFQVNDGLAQGGSPSYQGNMKLSKFGSKNWNKPSQNDVELNQVNELHTGKSGAGSEIMTEVNNGTNCGCFDDVENKARVYNHGLVVSNSGLNFQINKGLAQGGSNGDTELNQGNFAWTGESVATSSIWTVANSSYSAN